MVFYRSQAVKSLDVVDVFEWEQNAALMTMTAGFHTRLTATGSRSVSETGVIYFHKVNNGL